MELCVNPEFSHIEQLVWLFSASPFKLNQIVQGNHSNSLTIVTFLELESLSDNGFIDMFMFLKYESRKSKKLSSDVKSSDGFQKLTDLLIHIRFQVVAGGAILNLER